MPANTTDLEKRLWEAADELRANSKLKSSEYSIPVLGLIFLRYADWKFTHAEEELKNAGSRRRGITKADYQAKGVMYLPDAARFSTLLNLPGGADIGKAINDAMRAIEAENEELKDILPKTYNRLENDQLEIRQKLIQSYAVDVMIAVGSNFFYTVTLPCTLWFLDQGKADTIRRDKVLFLDARHIYRQIDRAHREFSAEQIEFLANIVRLYRGEAVETTNGSQALLAEKFPQGEYIDIPGLCKVATLEEIAAQGWSLNPGRYVGVAERVVEDFDFTEKLEELNEELEVLNLEARELEERIAENVAKLLEQS